MSSLVLAGPLLRRVMPDEVTVWVALREARTVTLDVFAGGSAGGPALLTGSRATVALGTNLHVVAVTARLAGTPVNGLLPEQLYSYDLRFDATHTLASADILETGTTGLAKLAYAGATHPTFALPPLEMGALRIVHGSCRKAHAPGQDALPALDAMIALAAAAPATFARERPHQLFLTGDQIYADDVADAMLKMLTDAGAALLGWEEVLPSSPGGPSAGKLPSAILPGTRQAVTYEAKMTSDHAKSHLLGLGEFLCVYLFAWSDAVWPATIPTVGDEDERDALATFRTGLPAVRRALANVPSYMIFDDHEVTDDWNLNRRWCRAGVTADERGGAPGHPLGRRVLLNGLVAYAICQAWGNTPERFAEAGPDGEPGRELLAAVETWAAEAGSATAPAATTALAAMEQRVGLAPALTAADDAFVRPAGALRWHYTVRLPDRPYEVVVIDARTMRGYPRSGGDWGPPALLSPDAFAEQLEALPAAPAADGVTIVIAPAPVLGIPFIETKQGEAVGAEVFEKDAEAWGLDKRTFQRLLGWAASRRRRVVLLSGDVHYAFAARLIYNALRPYMQPGRPAPSASVIAQLTASALRNESDDPGVQDTERQHRGGYDQFYIVGTAPPEDVKGWNVAPSAANVKIGVQRGFFSWRDYRLSDPAVLRVDKLPGGSHVNVSADWRYTVKWLTGFKDRTLPPPTPLTPFTGTDVQKLVKLDQFQREYAQQLRHFWGRDIVGRNNIGELRFEWPAGPGKQVRQKLWWQENSNTPIAPITGHDVNLDADTIPPPL